MSKTPEQMAKEYGDYFMPGEDNKAYTSLIKEIAFLAGYQAAKNEISRRIPSDQELHLQAMTSLSVGTSSHTNIQFVSGLGWVKKI